MPASVPRSTLVVVTWRGRDLVGRCLDALARQSGPHRLVVVDNASTDGTAEVLRAHPAAPRVVRLARNSGYAGALAATLPGIATQYVGWLNDDAEPEPGWLAALESTLDSRPEVAAAGSVLLATGGSVQSAGVRLTPLGYGADLGADLDGGLGADLDGGLGGGGGAPFGFCGGAVLLRTAALRAVGGVPARFFCYYEDTDTSWRLRLAGHDVVTVRAARVVHRHGASTEPGSPRFHRWNERNRLLMLVRCAPGWVAARELTRFAAITAFTAAAPLRRRRRPVAANFRTGLRLRVLAEVAAALPATLLARARIGGRATVPRAEVWRRWACDQAPRSHAAS